MSTTYAILILVFTVPAMAAELVSLIFPRTMIGLLQRNPEHVVNLPLTRALAVLSLLYMVDLGLLLFSKDHVFHITVLILLSMSMLLWGLKKYVVRYPAVVMFESTICLALLTNVLISVLRTLGLLKGL